MLMTRSLYLSLLVGTHRLTALFLCHACSWKNHRILALAGPLSNILKRGRALAHIHRVQPTRCDVSQFIYFCKTHYCRQNKNGCKLVLEAVHYYIVLMS